MKRSWSVVLGVTVSASILAAFLAFRSEDRFLPGDLAEIWSCQPLPTQQISNCSHSEVKAELQPNCSGSEVYPRLVINSAEYLYTTEGHDYLAADRLNPAGLSPLTQWVQREIYKHQHPPKCTKVSVTKGWPAGFGSEMHVMGSHLALAIERGRPLVWGPDACKALTNKRVCKSSRCQCFFRELSNCTASPGSETIGGTGSKGLVPKRFLDALKNAVPGITQAQALYWWRAQSVAYIMRLNRETVEAIRELRLDANMQVFSKPPVRTFPLPAGTINAHVRSGDKSKEMKLVPAAVHARAALDMVNRNPFSYHSRTLFVSTDDAAALAESGAVAARAGWTWVHSRIQRLGKGFVKADFMKLNESQRINFTVQVIHQLVMALEADGWVGTRGSNWNRLIDELRCVWVDKCLHTFVEVGNPAGGNYFW